MAAIRCVNGHLACAYSDGGACWAHVLHPSLGRRVRQWVRAVPGAVGTIATYAFYWALFAGGMAAAGAIVAALS